MQCSAFASGEISAQALGTDTSSSKGTPVTKKCGKRLCVSATEVRLSYLQPQKYIHDFHSNTRKPTERWRRATRSQDGSALVALDPGDGEPGEKDGSGTPGAVEDDAGAMDVGVTVLSSRKMSV